MANEKRLTTESERESLIRCLKMRHDAQFTPGVYEHSVIGRAALFLEETVDAVSVKDLERILSTTPGLELWDYQKRGIMSAVYRLCGKEKNDE